MTALMWFLSCKVMAFMLHLESSISTQGEIFFYAWEDVTGHLINNEQQATSLSFYNRLSPRLFFKNKFTEELYSRGLQPFTWFFQYILYFQRLPLANHIRGIKWKYGNLTANSMPLIHSKDIRLHVQDSFIFI